MGQGCVWGWGRVGWHGTGVWVGGGEGRVAWDRGVWGRVGAWTGVWGVCVWGRVCMGQGVCGEGRVAWDRGVWLCLYIIIYRQTNLA